jgi:uncharacterized protein
MFNLKPILSHFQATSLLASQKNGCALVNTSIDLGMSQISANLTIDGVEIAGAANLSWDQIQKINSDKNGCFIIENNSIRAVRSFSESTGRAMSLMPTPGAPALIIAGFPMHRIKNITPFEASKAMADSIAPFHGEVLDTATGLGYTALCAAQTATRVLTVEFDDAVPELAKLNPWSRELFTHDKITRIIGDSFEVIKDFPRERFCGIIHDPPTMSLAGDLYSGEFYKQAFRVLKPGGKMFHYLGDPNSSSGNRTTQGVIRRLHDAGFSKVDSKPSAYGVVAKK